jgi:hypothetical protein
MNVWTSGRLDVCTPTIRAVAGLHHAAAVSGYNAHRFYLFILIEGYFDE